MVHLQMIFQLKPPFMVGIFHGYVKQVDGNTKDECKNLWSLVGLEFWLLALPGKCTMSQAMVFLVGKPLIDL